MHQVVQLPARFGLFVGDVDFEQDLDRPAAFGGFALDGLGQPRAVDRMDQRDERGDILHLVGLEVADHVPFDILGQQVVFFTQFLWAALAENTVPGIVGLADRPGGVGLRHGDQRDILGQRTAHEG